MSDAQRSIQPGDLVRIRTERWRVARLLTFGDSAIVDVSGVDDENRGRHARFVQPFEPIERVVLPSAARVVRATEWRRVARRVLANSEPSTWALRTATHSAFDLLPYQLEP